MAIDTFESDLLNDVKFNDDGSLKQSGKQNVKFYNKKRMAYRARPLYVKDDDGVQQLDKNGKPVIARDSTGKYLFDIDTRTGLPFKDAYEEMVEMVRIETRGDTTVIDDIADDIRKNQFWPQYKFFREGKIPDGASLDEADWLYPQTIMELKLMGIHVIQQAALMTDLECDRLRDQSGYEVRELASQWVRINSPSGQAGRADRLALEVERLKRELADSQAYGSAKARMEMIHAAAVEDEREELPEESIRTVEMSIDEMKKGQKGRKRLVD